MLTNGTGNTRAAGGWRRRAWLLAGIVVFVGAFQFVYLKWLYPVYGYFGFENDTVPLPYLLLAWVLSVLPGFWMPTSLTRPSQLIYWVLYSTVFVPSMFVPLYMGSSPLSEIVVLMLTLFAGLAIIGVSYMWPVVRLPRWRLSRRTFWWGFAVITAAFTVWVLIVFRGNLHIVSFSDIYELRSAANEFIQGNPINYVLMWFSAVTGPLLLVLGLQRRKLLMGAAGVLIQVLVYSAIASKSVIISLVFIPLFSFLLRRGGASFGVKFIWGGASLLFLLCIGVLALTNPILNFVSFLVFMRTFGNSGLMTGQYYYFFHQNPLTYYSHIKGVNWVIHYPYGRTVAEEVGFYYSGDPNYDANAHFWATDGIGALGLPGVLLASLLCAVVFGMLDSVAQKHDVRLTAPLVSFAALNLANISIFTSLLSGGLGVLMLMLYVMPPEGTSDVGRRKGGWWRLKRTSPYP